MNVALLLFVWIPFELWVIDLLGKKFCPSGCRDKQPDGCRPVARMLQMAALNKVNFYCHVPKNVVHGLFYCLIIVFVTISFLKFLQGCIFFLINFYLLNEWFFSCGENIPCKSLTECLYSFMICKLISLNIFLS